MKQYDGKYQVRISTIKATEAAASVIFANSYMYSQLSTLHRVDYSAYSATLTWFSVHSGVVSMPEAMASVSITCIDDHLA